MGMHRSVGRVGMFAACLGLGAAYFADTPYKYFLTGSDADVQTHTTPGFALVGGGKDPDPAFRWFLKRSGGGDVVVLRVGLTRQADARELGGLFRELDAKAKGKTS